MQLVHNTTGSRPGYWGPVTSSINWCEPDYASSAYIAEWWNTISNLCYIITGIFSIIMLRRCLKDITTFPYYRMYVCSTAIIIIGVGSWCFHMTLMRQNQAFDEIAMNLGILCTAFCAWTCDDYQEGSIDSNAINSLPDGPLKKRKQWDDYVLRLFGLFNSSKSALKALVLILIFLLLLCIYDVNNPTLFQTLFALNFFLLTIYTFYRARYPSVIFLQSTDNAINAQEVKLHMHCKQRLAFTYFIMGSLGYALWLIDNFTCPNFEIAKLHAMWHFFTAFGSYFWGLFYVYAYYVDLWDRWHYELATNKDLSKRPVWVNESIKPPYIILKYWYGIIPIIEHVNKPEKKME
jgi:hypothetical protein